MTQKLSLTLVNEAGTVLDKWTSDDPSDEQVFKRLAENKDISSLTASNIKDAMNSTYWVKETRVYLIDAGSEAEAMEIFGGTDFDEDWANHDVEVGFER